jgi:hypothetical protein
MARGTREAIRQIRACSPWIGDEQTMTLDFERLEEIYSEG